MIGEAEAVKKIGVTKVFPVVTDKAVLPYVAYRRMSMEGTPMKTMTSAGNRDTAMVEVICFSKDYEGSVALAEAVREVLDCQRGELDGMVMRSCVLTDSEEGWQDDAYTQRLVFTIRVY